MEDIIFWFNLSLFALFGLMFFYQIYYVFVVATKEYPTPPKAEPKTYAVVIAARNEENVIGDLLDSLNAQNYPSECLDVYVVADNCDDGTAQVAREHGAFAFERFDDEHKGKSWVLDYAFRRISQENPGKYAGFFVFDADNILDKDFVASMNDTFSLGYGVVTSYRNSKNFGASWISGGYAIWFLRESKWLSEPRSILGNSCLIGGTGWLVASELVKDGWDKHMMTEDIQFSADYISKGNRIGYARDAMLFDEQPEDFKTSWRQRMRWSRGFYQVMKGYSLKLVKGFFGPNGASCYDAFCTVSPAMLISVIGIIVNVVLVTISCLTGQHPGNVVLAGAAAIGGCLIGLCTTLFAYAVITILTEWERIYAPNSKKILYMFTFPLFMLTYLPIAVVSVFKRNLTWKPIAHGAKTDAGVLQATGAATNESNI